MTKFKKLITVLLIAGFVLMTGCAEMSDWFSTTRGSLIGQNFKISTYDNSGKLTMTTTGSKINIGLYKNSANKSSDGTESGDFKSEVLDISIDGSQILSVGSTMIFEEKGIEVVKDFDQSKIENVDAGSGGSLVAIDRYINGLKNSMGKSRIIVISSQLGNPICVYQGDDVYVSIPSDLPKMTRLNIDGKSLYIHRANYQIIDSKLIN